MGASGYARRRAALTHDTRSWFGAGRAMRTLARRSGSCVECGTQLRSRRTPYCSRGCRWRFHGRFFWDAARRVVLRRDRYTCRSCGRRERQSALEVDHIREIARGGAPLDYANLQTLCRPCHRTKTLEFLRRPRVQLAAAEKMPAVLGSEEGPDWFPA